MAIDIGPRIGIDGEREFRASIANINQQIKTMDSEMRAAAAAFDRSNDAEGKNSATKKILTEQIEAQRRKLGLLQDALEKSATKYGENDTKTLKWRQAVADATTSLSKMEGELDDVGDELDDTSDEMADAEKKTSSFGDTAKGVFVGGAILDGIKAMGAAIKNLVNYGADVVTSTAEVGDQIDKQSQKLGISRKEYQQLSYALEMYGANVDGLQTGLKTLAVQAQKGSDAFDKLGLSQEFVKSASTEDLFEAVVGKLQGMAEGTERTAIANQLLGKSATELQPLLNDTQKNFAAIKNAAPLMSDATVDASAAMQDSMAAFQSTMTEIKSNVAGRVMPAITKALDTARSKLQTGEARKAIDKAGKALGDVAATVVTFAADALPKLVKLVGSVVKNWDKWALAIGGVVLAWKGFSIVKTVTQSINTAKVAFAGLNATMSANPIGALLSALGLLIGLLSAFALGAEDASDGMAGYSDNAREAVQDSRDLADAIRDSKDAYNDSASAIVAQADRTEDLWRQLQLLTDQTGYVDKADREHAQYILGQLNEALGTEYEMIDGQIKQYGRLRDGIDDVIKKKEAEALLSAGESQYTDALAKRGEQMQNILSIEDELNEKINRRNELQTEADELYQKLIDEGVDEQNAWAQVSTLYYESKDGIYAMDDAIGRLEDDLGDAHATLGEYTETIAKHDKATQEIAQGHYANAVALLTDETTSRWAAYKDGRKITEQEKADLKRDIQYKQREADIYRKKYLAGEKGFTKELVDQADAQVDALTQLLWDSNIEAYRAGKGVPENLSKGVESSRAVARGKVKEIVDDAVSAMSDGNTQAYMHGQRTTSSYGDGIAAGKDEATGVAKVTAAGIIKGFDCIEQANKMGMYIAQGLADGMTSQQKYVTQKVDALINGLLFGIADTAQIRSPSKVTKRFGRYIMQGLPAGMEEELPTAMASVNGMAGEILDALRIDPPMNALAYAGLGAEAGVSQPSYTTNMGGITINMSVAAPNVSNVNDLAGLVSDRIRDAIINAQQARR